jgi:hypothetical protein
MASPYPLNTRKIINLEPRYTYFFVRNISGIQLDYYVLKYSYPTVKSVPLAEYGNSETQITPLTDREYLNGTFFHPRYTNQTGQPLSFSYIEVPLKKV